MGVARHTLITYPTIIPWGQASRSGPGLHERLDRLDADVVIIFIGNCTISRQ